MKREKIKGLCRCALGAAVICLLAPISLPATPMPITLSLFAVLLVAAVLEPLEAVTATACYVALGAVGLPVFSGFTGGFHVLLGPTGGFIISYILAALVTSVLRGRKAKSAVAMAISVILCYFCGALWMYFTTNTGFWAIFASIFATCAIPDGIKIALAVLVSDKLQASRIGGRANGR